MPQRLKIATSTPIFYLPYYVADDEGYFRDEGLEVELQHKGSWPTQRGPVEFYDDPDRVSAFSSLNSFERGTADLYNACEWGQLRRSQDSERSGQVVSRRAAVASQAIIVRPDSAVNVPGDLANTPVGVNFHHGSHYLVLQTLEGFIARDEIKLIGIKGKERFLALRDGDVDAVAVMEPWITVADKLGYKIIAEAHYFGAEVAHPDVDAETLSAINRAVSRGVDRIHADIRPYLHYFVDVVPDDIVALEDEDFNVGRLRYIHPGPYPEDHFNRTLDWIASWGLIHADNEFVKLVDNSRVEAISA